MRILKKAKRFPLQPLRLEEFDLVVQTSTAAHRIAKIAFQKRDGSIRVMFPTFVHNEGLVGRVTVPGGLSKVDRNLGELGKVAGQLVKYSHHPDGRAHFSQDGRVRTEIINHCLPLARQQTHLFTIMVEGLEGFGPPKKSDHTTMILKIEGRVHTLKILGRWFQLKSLKTTNPIQMRGPMPLMNPDGTQQVGWLVAPPEGSPFADFGLFLTPQEWAVTVTGPEGPHLSFFGGFDEADPSQDVSFLALSYPCSDPEKLRETIGSIDLAPRR